MNQLKKILIYGYGNPGRKDDALGILLAEKVGEWAKEKKNINIEIDSNYQLNIEDAFLIKDKDIVIFTDASIEKNCENYLFSKVYPSEKIEFTMHAVTPAFVLDLCNKLYNSFPIVYLLHIRGYEWELKEELTTKARNNLKKAFEFITDFINNELKGEKSML